MRKSFQNEDKHLYHTLSALAGHFTKQFMELMLLWEAFYMYLRFKISSKLKLIVHCLLEARGEVVLWSTGALKGYTDMGDEHQAKLLTTQPACP